MVEEHKRRKRYSGKYPKHFDEKYKELHPEQYAGIIEHRIKKGATPAGMHISIMVDECLEHLEIMPGDHGLDCTLGYGGHTRHMLEKLEGKGHIYGLDVDAIEIEKTKERLSKLGYGQDIFTAIHTNFRNIDKVAEEYGKFDFVLADLGVSSMQIDNPERGFSYKANGPLDLRLDPTKGIPASEYLKTLSKWDIEHILSENSDEPYASEIAKTIDSYQKSGMTIDTTSLLYKIIDKSLPHNSDSRRKDLINKTAARVFQAIRIEVNQEFEVLYEFMDKLPTVLKPGGRAVILTFHSGEDRIVKKSFKEMKNLGIYSDVARNVIRPTSEECHRNPRAKSTKLRWAIKSYKE